MSKHYIIEYSRDEKPGGAKKTKWTLSGFWIVVIILLFIYTWFGRDQTIGEIIRRAIAR